MNIKEITSSYIETSIGVSFEPRTHTYTYNGNRVVSVTQFLGIIKNKNYEGVASHYRNNAALIGSMVHAVTEAIDAGKNIDEYEMASEILRTNGYLSFETSESDIEYYMSLMCENIGEYSKTYKDGLKFYNIENHAAELVVFNKELNYAGTIDRISTIDGEPYIIDIKTSRRIEPLARLQVIAYGMCVPELKGHVKYAVMQLKKEEKVVQFNLEKFTYDEYLESVVRSAKEVYDFAESYGIV